MNDSFERSTMAANDYLSFAHCFQAHWERCTAPLSILLPLLCWAFILWRLLLNYHEFCSFHLRQIRCTVWFQLISFTKYGREENYQTHISKYEIKTFFECLFSHMSFRGKITLHFQIHFRNATVIVLGPHLQTLFLVCLFVICHFQSKHSMWHWQWHSF